MAEYTIKEDEDLVLPPQLPNVWITVDNFSVNVRRAKEDTVVVDVYPLHGADGEPLATTYVHPDELKEVFVECDECGAQIPATERSQYNEHHLTSCSLHPSSL